MDSGSSGRNEVQAKMQNRQLAISLETLSTNGSACATSILDPRKSKLSASPKGKPRTEPPDARNGHVGKWGKSIPSRQRGGSGANLSLTHSMELVRFMQHPIKARFRGIYPFRRLASARFVVAPNCDAPLNYKHRRSDFWLAPPLMASSTSLSTIRRSSGRIILPLRPPPDGLGCFFQH